MKISKVYGYGFLGLFKTAQDRFKCRVYDLELEIIYK